MSRPLHLTILTQFAPPEPVGTAHLIGDLAAGLVESGVRIKIMAGQPSNTSMPEDKHLPALSMHRGATLRRLPHLRLPHQQIWGRIINSALTTMGAVLALLRLPKSDILLVDTSSPCIALAGPLLWRLRRQRYVYLIEDLYPAIASRLGAIRPGGLIERLWKRLVHTVLQHAASIILLGQCMKQRLVAEFPTVDAGRLQVIHNWNNGLDLPPCPRDANPFVREHALMDRFVVLYSGNFGRGHDLDTLLDAATKLKRDPDFLFLLIGDGPGHRSLQERVRRDALSNVRFLPYQPEEMLRYSLTSGDVSVVSIRKGIEGLLLPGKFFTTLAAGQALIAIAETGSDVVEIIERGACGIRIAPGDSDELVRALNRLRSDPAQLQRLRRNARTLYEREFDRPRAIRAYLEALRSVARNDRPRAAAAPPAGSSVPQ